LYIWVTILSGTFVRFQMSSSMSKDNKELIEMMRLRITALGVLALAVVAVVAVSWPAAQLQPVPVSPGLLSAEYWSNASDEERAEILSKTGRKVDLATVSVKYRLRVPKNTLDGELLGAYLHNGTDPNNPSLTLLYERGLRVEQWAVDAQPPDYHEWLAEMTEAKKQGILLSDSLPQVVEINGFQGFAHEGGYNVISETKKFPRPAYVTWYENGAIYAVYGDGIPLAELKTVVESMFD